jgi:uncharacterized protein (DUF1015 family)|tara:strand:- start:6526 stop:7674 length:1149 start_codon:yes stop_codon:yes gene_type:complete
MVEITGLTGYRPKKEKVAELTTPAYDVIDRGSDLEALLKGRPNSLWHIILGDEPKQTLDEFISNGVLQEDKEPCFYVHEQIYNGKKRTGVFVAAKVGKDIFDHEDTNKDKVQGRLKLAQDTGYSFGPVYTLTESPINKVLNEIKKTHKPLYEFTSDFGGFSDLDGILNGVFHIKANSPEGLQLIELIEKNELDIADGHHRYKATMLNGQQYALTYICEAKDARIQAYNRVINGLVKFNDIKDKLKNLQEIRDFKTPDKEHQICIYTGNKTYLWNVTSKVPDSNDLIGSLDVSILENELDPLLKIKKEHTRKNSEYVGYYPESQLDEMKKLVQSREYEIAIALHPVSVKKVIEVARSGKKMPPKSTYFDKILSGIFTMKNNCL